MTTHNTNLISIRLIQLTQDNLDPEERFYYLDLSYVRRQWGIIPKLCLSDTNDLNQVLASLLPMIAPASAIGAKRRLSENRFPPVDFTSLWTLAKWMPRNHITSYFKCSTCNETTLYLSVITHMRELKSTSFTCNTLRNFCITFIINIGHRNFLR